MDIAPFKKWQRCELMEFAKDSLGGGDYNLTHSSVPSYTRLADLPGGPFEFALWGQNFYGHEGLKAALAEWYGAQP